MIIFIVLLVVIAACDFVKPRKVIKIEVLRGNKNISASPVKGYPESW